MAISHQFAAQLEWHKGDAGAAAMNHSLSFAGRPSIEVSAAPQYKGDPSRLNPEELLLASLASCQMLTYVVLAGRAGIDVLSYADDAQATLAIADRKMRVTEVLLRPRITLAPGQDVERARALVESAHDGCFIANSVACAVRIEPEITSG